MDRISDVNGLDLGQSRHILDLSSPEREICSLFCSTLRAVSVAASVGQSTSMVSYGSRCSGGRVSQMVQESCRSPSSSLRSSLLRHTIRKVEVMSRNRDDILTSKTSLAGEKKAACLFDATPE